MTAAAVVLSLEAARALVRAGLRDSKALTRAARRRLFDEIVARAEGWAVAHVGPDEIDRVGIARATAQAFREAIAALPAPPAFALVDGRLFDGLGPPAAFIVRGESASASIAAASIVAKESRDRLMDALDAAHPGYGLAVHKGYGTPDHLRALRRLGASPIHRRSFAGVVSEARV